MSNQDTTNNINNTIKSKNKTIRELFLLILILLAAIGYLTHSNNNKTILLNFFIDYHTNSVRR